MTYSSGVNFTSSNNANITKGKMSVETIDSSDTDTDTGVHGPSVETHTSSGEAPPPACRISESGNVCLVTQGAIGEMADPIDSAL